MKFSFENKNLSEMSKTIDANLFHQNFQSINGLTRTGTLTGLVLTKLTLPDSSDDFASPIPEITQAENNILNVATASYLGLVVTNGSPELRYFDWVITTPLLTYTYWKLVEDWGWDKPFETLGISAALMSALGYLAQKGKTEVLRKSAFLISSLFFLVIVIEVLRINTFLQQQIPEERKGLLGVIPWFFILGWGLYPLVFYASKEIKDTVWNLLDLINKPIYTLVYNRIINQIYS
jgi:bacteriorhodopsin